MAMKESPNWLEMPPELMTNILERLHFVDIIHSARKVCTTWRRICKDPAMWKVIDMLRILDVWDTLNLRYDIQRMVLAAIDLSCGELIDIRIKGFVTDNFLDYLVLRSSKLKHICFLLGGGIKGSGLSRAVKRVPQLESLHLIRTYISAEHIEAIGWNCPHLKSFKMNIRFRVSLMKCGDVALAIAKSMPGLHHLQLLGSNMTNDGLQAILKGCPHLQSLDVRMCGKLNLGGNLLKQCMEQIKDFKHGLTQNRSFFKSELYED